MESSHPEPGRETYDARELPRNHGENGAWQWEPHMSAERLAALFGITSRTVKKYARDGLWPHARPPGRGGAPYLFCRHDVAAIVASLGHDETRGR